MNRNQTNQPSNNPGKPRPGPIEVHKKAHDEISEILEGIFRDGCSISESGAEEGFRYQKEITLHLSIMCRINLDKNCEFSLMHEVRNFDKIFDDTICQIKLPSGESHYLAVQSKHKMDDGFIISEDDFFDGNNSSPFNMTKYFKPQANPNNINQKNKVFTKCILLTNANHDLNLKDYVEDISGSDDILKKLKKVFANIENKGAKIQKFTDKSKTVWRKWFNKQNIRNSNFNDFFNFIKDHFILVTNAANLKNITKMNSDLLKNIYEANSSTNQDAFYNYVREGVMQHIEVDQNGYTKQMEKQDFESILQNTILKVDLSVISESFPFKVSFDERVRRNICEKIIKHQIVNQNLKNLVINELIDLKNKYKTNIILWSSLTKRHKIALNLWNQEKIVILCNKNDDDFVINLKEKGKFIFESIENDKYNEICQNINKEQKRLRIKKRNLLFECKRDELFINALKLSQAIRKSDENDNILRWSKLGEKHRNALKYWNKHDLVVMLDTNDSVDYLRENRMLIFVKESQELNENPLSFLLDDLTGESRQDFLKKTIKIQNVEVELQACFEENIADTKKRDELFRDIFLENFQGKVLELFSQFSQYKIPEIDISRIFKQKQNNGNIQHIKEKELLNELHSLKYCMIQGKPGIGKTTILKKIANNFRENYPHLVVQFLNLGEPTLNVEFLANESKGNPLEYFSTEEAKNFLMRKLLTDKSVLSEKFIEYYLSSDEHPVILIIDGFNEIMPDYESVVVDFIKKLSSFNIKIFVSGRLDCDEVLENLKDITIETLEPLQAGISRKNYDKNQVKKFIKEFIKNKNSDSSLNFNEFYNIYPKDMELILANPLFLKVAADNFLQIKSNQSNLEYQYQLNEHNVYEKTFISSFDRILEKKGNNPEVTLNQKEIMCKIRKHHIKLACNEIRELKDFENSEILRCGFVSRNDKSFYFSYDCLQKHFQVTPLFSKISRSEGEYMKIGEETEGLIKMIKGLNTTKNQLFE